MVPLVASGAVNQALRYKFTVNLQISLSPFFSNDVILNWNRNMNTLSKLFWTPNVHGAWHPVLENEFHVVKYLLENN